MMRIMNQIRFRNNFSKCNNIFSDVRHTFKKLRLISFQHFCNSDSSNDSKEKENKYYQKDSRIEYPDIIRLLFEKNVKLKKLPCFEVYSSQIEILNQPMDFYLALIKLIRTAKTRICISSLYLGVGKMEEYIVEELLQALKRNPNLKITILLDYGRGTRLEKGKDSLMMLEKLLIQVKIIPNIKIAFFMNPRVKLTHKFLPILSEIKGVLHSKLLIFDNFTIITGANLSHNYFTTRQDRYYVIQECEPFADYCEDYINSLVNVSYTTNSIGDLIPPQHIANPMTNKVEYMSSILQQFKMFKYDNRVKIPAGYELKIDEYFENLEKFNNNYHYRSNAENLIEFKQTRNEFLKLLINEDEDKKKFLKIFKEESINKREVDNFQEEKISHRSSNDDSEKISNSLVQKPPVNKKVLIFPSFQFFNINQFDDQEILSEILSSNLFSNIKFSSGYLNLPDFLIDIIQKAEYDFSAVTSSPRANSFYKAGFLKKNIPYFYRRYEELLLKKLKGKTNCSLYEFEKEGWSFHSKGLWLYEKGKNLPTMTIIGNYRSYERDIESQFYIYSFSEEFNQRLQYEAEDCFYDTTRISLNNLKNDKDVRLKLRHKIMAKFLRKFL